MGTRFTGLALLCGSQSTEGATMTRNMGTLDRAIRFVAGVMLLGLYGALLPPWKYLTLIGLIPVGTALTGNCPLYTLFGWSTCPKPAPKGP